MYTYNSVDSCIVRVFDNILARSFDYTSRNCTDFENIAKLQMLVFRTRTSIIIKSFKPINNKFVAKHVQRPNIDLFSRT